MLVCNNPNYSKYYPNFASSRRTVQNKYNQLSLQNNSNRQIRTPKLKKLLPVMMLSLFAIGCHNINNKVQGNSKVDNMTIVYDDVPQENVDAMLDLLNDIQARGQNSNFLDGVTVTYVNNFKDLTANSKLQQHLKNGTDLASTRGISFYSDEKIPREIVIQEDAYKGVKFINLFKKHKLENTAAVRQTLAHEIGHQFDSYFGHDHNAKFATKWDSILAAKNADSSCNMFETPTDDKEIDASILYHMQNGLSDKEAFKEAVLKDLTKIFEMKKNGQTNLLSKNLYYYISSIDPNIVLNKEYVNILDACRSEIYANLFSYAMNEDDGDRSRFIDNFSNSYKVVQEDIATYLK